MGAKCDSDQYMVIAKVRERSTVSKQAAQKLYVERFKIRTLNELEVKIHYQIKISNRFATLENLSDSKYMDRVWENIKGSIKTSVKKSLGLYELKQHKPWFDEQYFKILDEKSWLKCRGYKIQTKAM